MSIQPPRNEENPYAAPQGDAALPIVLEEVRDAVAERIRNEYLNDEFLVRLIGTLFYLLGALLLFATAWYLTLVYLHVNERFPTWADAPNNRVYLIFGVVWHGLLGATALSIGHGLWTLHNWVHIVIGAIAVLFFLLFMPSIVIFGPICFLLFHPRSRYVCSSEYRSVVQTTCYLRFSRFLFLGFMNRSFFALSFMSSIALFIFLAFPSMR